MKEPQISASARVLRGAVVTGDVTLAEQSNVWHNAVLRADIGTIRVGPRSNIQDGSVLHMDEGCTLEIGADVTVGHACILHGCTIKDGALIGMGSILLDGAEIGEGAIIGAGSLVTRGTVIPPGMMAFGRPAKPVRPATEEEKQHSIANAAHYVQLASKAE